MWANGNSFSASESQTEAYLPLARQRHALPEIAWPCCRRRKTAETLRERM